MSYINLDYKNLDYKIYITTLANRMPKTLDAAIGENRSAVIKSRRILHTFSTIRDVIYVSNKLNSNIALISLNFREPFTKWIGISCHS